VGKGISRWILTLGLCSVLWLGACGEVSFFFFWNTGNLGGTPNAAAGIFVIGTPVEDPEEVNDIQIVSGRVPRGMKLMEDGTIQGVPQETGFFAITQSVHRTDGSVEERFFEAEIQ
jgi:hypothetical protein